MKKRPATPKGPKTGQLAPVERIHGLRACLAVLATRPQAIVRLACTRPNLAAVEQAAAGHDLAIGVLSDAEVERLAHSNQHEGLVLEVEERPWLSSNELADHLVRTKGVAIALDRVRNSYNIGAILRSAAFFGVDAVLLGAPAPHPGLDPNAIRVAEGGVEHLAVARTTDLADTLGRLAQRGIAVFGADGEGAESALGFAFRKPAILVLGNEREGMSPRVRAQCAAILAIRGSGAVESLNVAVAASIFLAELTRPS